MAGPRPIECPITGQVCAEAYCAGTRTAQREISTDQLKLDNYHYSVAGVPQYLVQAERTSFCRIERIQRLHRAANVFGEMKLAEAMMDRINFEREEANADPEDFGWFTRLPKYIARELEFGVIMPSPVEQQLLSSKRTLIEKLTAGELGEDLARIVRRANQGLANEDKFTVADVPSKLISNVASRGGQADLDSILFVVFGIGGGDDVPDAVSQAVAFIRDEGLLQTDTVFDRGRGIRKKVLRIPPKK